MKAFSNIDLIKISLIATILVAFLFQVIIDKSLTNFIFNLLLSISGIISCVYLFQQKTFLPYPISSLMIFGYSLYYFILPPVITGLENNPSTNNLIKPIYTGIHASITLLTLILAHYIYKSSYISRVFKLYISKFYKITNVFYQLNFRQIVVMSFIVISAQLIFIFFKSGESESPIIKFFQGVSYFIFIPFILTFSSLFNLKKTKKKFLFFLVFYSAIILTLGVLLNGRTFIFIGFFSIIILYFFSLLFEYSKIHFTKKNALRGLLLLSISFYLIEPITKLSIAFVLARNVRSEVSSKELLFETISKYNEIENSSRVLQLLNDIEKENGIWDEYYITNPFFSRLCNLKFADNIFVMGESLDEFEKSTLKKSESDKVIAILPTPILKLFSFDTNKEETNSGSFGDFIFYITTGGQANIIGGFRTGSLIGSSFILFNWFYPLFLGFFSYIIFLLVDPLVKLKENNFKNIIISPIAFLSFFPFLFYFTSAASGVESFSGLFSFILRGSFEKPILYFLLVKISTTISK